MNWFLDVVKNKYATFQGRAHREEFWMFTLIFLLIYIILCIIDYKLNTQYLALIFDLAMIVPGLAVGARRLHDTNRSGWWQLLAIIPIIGWIILIVWCAMDSHAGSNQYGENPKEQTA